MSQLFVVHPDNPQLRLLKQAAQLLQEGGLVAVPTDSSYAVVARLDDKGRQTPCVSCVGLMIAII
jgi:tRNA A37 threonylcarbamoyladenosine synthetase subunit TsaC/SUA5/YrdC